MTYCFNCNSTEDIKFCKNCRQLLYCSIECQFALYEKHKKLCNMYKTGDTFLKTCLDDMIEFHIYDFLQTNMYADHVLCVNYGKYSLCELLESNSVQTEYLSKKDAENGCIYCREIFAELSDLPENYTAFCIIIPSLNFMRTQKGNRIDIIIHKIRID